MSVISSCEWGYGDQFEDLDWTQKASFSTNSATVRTIASPASSFSSLFAQTSTLVTLTQMWQLVSSFHHCQRASSVENVRCPSLPIMKMRGPHLNSLEDIDQSVNKEGWDLARVGCVTGSSGGYVVSFALPRALRSGFSFWCRWCHSLQCLVLRLSLGHLLRVCSIKPLQ